MQRLLALSALLLSLLAMPAGVFAQPPPIVTGVTAHFANGQIDVAWQMPEGAEDIAAYRIYMGQNSILDTAGAYDDFVTAGGNLTHFLITDIPAYPQLFIAVKAVNATNEEGPAFTEELRLDLTTPVSEGELRQRPVDAPPPQPAVPATFGVVFAESASDTEIAVTFSAPVHIAENMATQAFVVSDERGNTLAIHQLTIRNDRIVLLTDPLAPGTRYGVVVNPIVTGGDENGTLALDPEQSQAGFITPGVQVAEVNTADREVRNIRVILRPEPDGFSSVGVAWDPPLSGEVASYRLTPVVPGVSVGAPQIVPPDARLVRFSGIPGRAFLITIQVIAPDGSVTPGITASAVIDSSGSSGLLARTLGQKDGLAGSGPGLLVVVAGSGAMTAWYRARRKKKAALSP